MSTIEATEITDTVLTVGVQASAFKRALANAAVFASNDYSRPILCAVRLELNGSELRVVSTDSYALYVETVAVDAPPNRPTKSFLLDVAEAKKLVKTVADSDLITVLHFGETLTVEAGSSTMIFSAVASQYPDFQAIIDGHKDGTLETVAFGSKLLAKVAKVKPVSHTTSSTGNACVMHLGTDNLKAVRVTVGTDIAIYLMPVRVA